MTYASQWSVRDRAEGVSTPSALFQAKALTRLKSPTHLGITIRRPFQAETPTSARTSRRGPC